MEREKTIRPDRHTFLTQTPVPQLIRRLAVPTIISMLVTGIYSAADTYFVGRISTEATAAVGLVFSVMSIIQAFGFFFGQGSGNYLSRLLGAGKRDKASEIASTGFALALCTGLLFAVIGNLFAYPIARFIGATDASVENAVSYLRIILLGAPFMIGQFVINNQLRFQGSAMYAMIGLMCGAVMNIGLDPLLMFGFGMGARGAAVATVIGQIVSFFVLLIGSTKGGNIRLSFKKLRFTRDNVLQIANGGLPSLFRQGLASVATVLLNQAAGSLGGDPGIAGMSIVSRLMMLTICALIGFGQGYQPVCSYNAGAGLYARVREGYFYCIRIGTVMMTAAGLICFFFAEPIIGWFRDDPAVIAIGAAALRWQAVALPLLATGIITNMMLQASGKGIKSSVTSSARNGIFFIPLILILPRIFGMQGVEMSQACADVLTFFLCLPFAASELRKMK